MVGTVHTCEQWSRIAHAAVSRNGQWQDLGTLTGDPDSYGFGINGDGHAVGYSRKSISGTEVRDRAFLFAGEAIAEVNELPHRLHGMRRSTTRGRSRGTGIRRPTSTGIPGAHSCSTLVPASSTSMRRCSSTSVCPMWTAVRPRSMKAAVVVGFVRRASDWMDRFPLRRYRQRAAGNRVVHERRLGRQRFRPGRRRGVHTAVHGRESPTPTQHAISYDSATEQVRDLGTLGGASSLAYDVNSAGHVVGAAALALPDDGWTRAFLYRDGRIGGPQHAHPA